MKYKTYWRIISLLKRSGYSPRNAIQTLMDCRYGDRVARRWIKSAFRSRHLVENKSKS